MVSKVYKNIDILKKQEYIFKIKAKFLKEFCKNLNLIPVTAPIFVTEKSGLQDRLSGVERPVKFDVKKTGETLEVVQSLAKWKRIALKKYNFPMHKGLCVDMKAIRRDDCLDNIHSIFVDQWDWEKVIKNEDRNLEYLKQTVKLIVKSIVKTSKYLQKIGFRKQFKLSNDVKFITSQELCDMFPDKSPKQREYEIVKKFKTVFIIGIGDLLKNGERHDSRSPDYDDWTLNGDLFFYHDINDMALEVSSMGIRVNKSKMIEQIEKFGNFNEFNQEYHKLIKENKLPLTIGGGIGQSRICQLLLERKHIGEVQVSYWDKENIKYSHNNSINLL